MLSALKFFRIGNGQLAIFNTYDTININQIDNLLKKVDHKYRLPKITSCSDFYRASKNKLTLIMDCGTPTKEKTHAGTLSFEFSHLSEKIVVNCGSPFVNNKNWHDAMRSTAAHSTLNINEINSSDIFFEKDTTTRIAKTHSSQFNDNDNICIDSYHTGYRSLFGLLHRRLIHIDQKKTDSKGRRFFNL
ncbi:MAG: heparinase II/III family protein [Alphaproteobacteria bacterium]